MAKNSCDSVYDIETKLSLSTHVMTVLGDNGKRYVDMYTGLFRVREFTPKKYVVKKKEC